MIKLILRDPNYYKKRSRPTSRKPIREMGFHEPCPAIGAIGIGGVFIAEYEIIQENEDMAKLRATEGMGGLFDVREASDIAGYDPTSSTPPAEWPDFSAGIETEFRCPRCAYEWRGAARPGAAEVEAEGLE
jgi:hypothetical protein